MGFYGDQVQKLWCLSQTGSLHLWQWQAACDEEAQGTTLSFIMHGKDGEEMRILLFGTEDEPVLNLYAYAI
jgi:hypothetical protein